MAEYLPKILKFAAAQPIAENCIIIRNSFPKDVPIVCQKSHLHREQRDPSIFFPKNGVFRSRAKIWFHNASSGLKGFT